MDKIDNWRQTVSSQHQMWATIAGFAINGLFIFITFKSGQFNLIQKVLFTTSIFSLIVQVVLMIYLAQLERSTAFQPSEFLQNLENILRPILNITSAVSWILISVLLVVSIWMR